MHFNPAPGGGSAIPTEVAGNIDGNGLYRTRYTTGTVPSKNSIEAWGEADIQAREIIWDNVAKVHMSRTAIPAWKPVTLKSGQQASFDTAGASHADNCFIDNATQKTYCYSDNPEKFSKINYTVYGVDVHLAVEPNIVLINEDGQTTADTTFKYTILPPEYNAIIADVDIFKTDETGTDTWISYIAGDKIQGQGSAGYVKGSKFDINTHYKAQVVLNRGSAIEIKSRTEINNDNIGNDNSICEQNEECDKITLPIGKIELFTIPTTTTEASVPVIGAVTDGVTKLQLKLTVKYGFDELPNLNWKLMDTQLFSAATNTERGSLLSSQGGNIESWPVTFDLNSEATATYCVPQTFVRFGTPQEVQDRDRPERNVRIQLTDSSNNAQGGSDIRLKRPPVMLVHGLWGDVTTWDKFEPLIQTNTAKYTMIRADYTTGDYSNDGPIARNAPVLGDYIEQALGVMEKQQFAATKADVIAHSIGGLITRKYCEDNLIDCEEHVRKLVTIDTPHLGSELADLLIIYRDHRDLFPNPGVDNLIMPSCHTLINWFVRGKRFLRWRIPSHPLGGGIDDLASGRWTEFPFNLVDSGNWTSLSALGSETSGLNVHTIAGMATATGHDIPIWFLWNTVLEPCGFTRARVFPAEPDANDRIVTMSSQEGIMPLPATATEQVNGVDHSSILNDIGAITKVRDLLDSKVEPPTFLMEY